MDVEDGGGAAARMNVEEGLTKPVHSPSGVQKIYTARGASLDFADGMGWDGMDGMGWGIKSVLQFSLNFVSI